MEENQQNTEENWQGFWAGICLNPDGSLNLEQVKRELSDYHALMGEVTTVYDTLTMGNISKPNTKASAVISEVERIQQRDLDQLEQELTLPTTPATPDAGAAGFPAGSWLQQAEATLSFANGPTAEPNGRARWAGILASQMTGVLEEARALLAQLHTATTAHATAEAAGQWQSLRDRLPIDYNRQVEYYDETGQHPPTVGPAKCPDICSYSHWRYFMPPAPTTTSTEQEGGEDE